MTLIDIVVLAIIVLFGVAGGKRGLVWEIFTIAGIVAGLWIPYIFRVEIADFIARNIGPGHLRIITTVAAFLFIFIAIYIISSYLGYSLRNLLKKVFLGWLDRALGVLAGLVKGVLIVSLLLVALMASPWNHQSLSLIRKSKLLTWGKKQIERVIGQEFGDLRDRV
jgi:membrane protein required for colicin V production